MSRLERYERRTAGPMTVLALVFLASYAIPILDPSVGGVVRALCSWADVGVWVAFALDLAWRVRLADHRGAFLLSHPVDVLAVALPVFRTLRVLRVFAVSQTIFTRKLGLLAHGQAILVGAVLLVVVAALAMLDAERGAADASITSIGDALWWGITTITTVGYGDMYPVTGLGRVVAAALMLVGISMVGIVSASVATWFVSQDRSTQGREQQDLVGELAAELVAVRAQLASIQQAVGADNPAARAEQPHRQGGPTSRPG